MTSFLVDRCHPPSPARHTPTDYDGDTAYGDLYVPALSSNGTEWASYEPGLAQVESWTDEGDGQTLYQLTDHLGTVRGYSNGSGSIVDPAVYTAFGERIHGEDHRYGYIGAWGYQEDGRFLHVGARYYDPSTGRFLQRDPIGVAGGLNSYQYANNSPTASIDPDGHCPLVIPIAAGIWVLDEFAEWANAPGPNDPIYSGGAGGSVPSIVAGGYVGGRLLGAVARHGGRIPFRGDRAFIRWGEGIITRPGVKPVWGLRFAIGGKGWPFHIHIHRNTPKYIWEWFWGWGPPPPCM